LITKDGFFNIAVRVAAGGGCLFNIGLRHQFPSAFLRLSPGHRRGMDLGEISWQAKMV